MNFDVVCELNIQFATKTSLTTTTVKGFRCSLWMVQGGLAMCSYVL